MGRVTLTFDNGPDEDITPGVLDVLERHAVKASFFVIGEKLREPALYRQAEQAHDAGHWIGNHSMTHGSRLGKTGGWTRRNENRRGAGPYRSIVSSRCFFRPFGGGGHLDRRLLSHGARDILSSKEFTCVLWNVIPRDWEDAGAWVERALQHASSKPKR